MKKLLAIVTTLAFALTLSACKGGEDTIKFGVIGPLTTGYSIYGEAVRDGALLAAKEINAAGGVLGKDLEIIAYDSKGDAVEGVNAYNRLRDQDEVDAIIGGTFSGVTLAIKDIAVDDGMPILTPTATNPSVTLNAANVFRACYNDTYQGSRMAVFVAENMSATNVAVFYNIEDAYSEGLAQAFMDEFDARSLSYTAYTFGASDVDYTAQLTNIKNGSFDAVFMPAYVPEVGLALTQADQLGLDVPFVGGDGWDGIEGEYAALAEGFYFGNHYSKDDETAVVQNFVTNFTEEYDYAPNALAALAYDAVYAMAQAFEDAGSSEHADVVAALSGMTYTGAVTGDFTLDENGDSIKPITVIQIVSGLQTVAAKIEPDSE